MRSIRLTKGTIVENTLETVVEKAVEAREPNLARGWIAVGVVTVAAFGLGVTTRLLVEQYKARKAAQL